MESAHTPEPRIPAELLDRYIAGECDAAERARVTAWLGSMPESTFQELFRLGAGIAPERTRAAWQHLRGTTTLDREHGIPGERQDSVVSVVEEVFSREERGKEIGVSPQFLRQGIASIGPRTLRRWRWIGGVMALAIGFIVLVFQLPESHTESSRVYATTARQEAVINLADGTRVTLSPQTTLRMQQFGVTSRTVVIDSGEAYFNVAHASGLPFIVRSGTTVVQVLGTEFLIRTTAGTPHVRVAVADGKVRVTTLARDKAGLTLTRGQVGDVTDSTTQVTTTEDLAPDVEWAPGRIMFRHMPLVKVLRTVSQWYGYHFRYTDQTLGAQNVTMMISTRSSAEALATIEQLLAVNLTVVGDTIILIPHAPRSSPRVPRVRTYDVWTPTTEVGR